MTELKIEYLPVDALKPYERNAKLHPAEQVEFIANSIRDFGWQQPIVVDKNNVIIIGHGRFLAAKYLGYDSVPVVCADDLDDEEVKALRLADNKTNESAWDYSILENEVRNISFDGLQNYGFDLSFMSEIKETIDDHEDENGNKNIVCPRCGAEWEL